MNTLSSYHKNINNEINNIGKKNIKIEKKINILEKKINILEKKGFEKMSTDEIKNYYKLKNDLIEEKKNLKNKDKEFSNYHLDVVEHLIEYNDINIDYLKQFDNKKKTEQKVFNFDNKKNDISSFINDDIEQNKDKKKDIFEKYLEKVEENYIGKTDYISDFTNCNLCGTFMKLDEQLSYYICETCGFINNIVLLTEKQKNVNSSVNTNNFTYKRISHFIEWLNNLQGKGNITIPDEVIVGIKKKIKKLKLNKKNIVTKTIIKNILEKDNLTKYNDQITYILNIVNGKDFPNFGKDLEEKMIVMFKQVQEPFQKHCPKNRSNFLNYSYCIIKFLELLGHDEYIQYVDKLKSREKIYNQEQIWKKICKELRWEFISSI